MTSAGLPLLRFHLTTGVRLALRAVVPLAGAFVVGIGLTPDAGATLRRIALEVSAPRPSAGTLAAMLLVGFGLAAWAAPRLAFGTSGWIRHLPAAATAHRRAVAAGLLAAQLPLLLPLAVLLAGLRAFEGGGSPWRLAALPIFGLALGTALAPSARRGVVLPLGIAAAAVALEGEGGAILTSLALLAAADRVAGTLPAVKSRPERREGRLPFPERMALRAAWGGLPAALVAAALPMAAGYAFLRNNDLPPDLAGLGARLAGAFTAATLVGSMADRLAVFRPPWPWARSLPWSAARRVGADAAVLAAFAAPSALATAFLDPWSGAAVACVIPLAALRGAAAVRRDGSRRTPASGPVLAEGAFGSAALALVPWLALAALAAVPWALRHAVRRERDVRVSRWAALHHLAAGDPLSWRER